MYNEYLVWELAAEKRAEAERRAEEARLAASVAGPDPTGRIGVLVLLLVAAMVLLLII